MAYEITVAASARRALQRMPEKVATAVIELLYGSLAADPLRVGKPLVGALAGTWSARRGSYRVIYLVDDGRKVVTVLGVAHRADAYRTPGA